jgi:hypothetical protein
LLFGSRQLLSVILFGFRLIQSTISLGLSLQETKSKRQKRGKNKVRRERTSKVQNTPTNRSRKRACGAGVLQETRQKEKA